MTDDEVAGHQARCPICTEPCDPGAELRCRRCHADLRDPAFAQIVELDAQIAAFRAEYDALAVRWQLVLAARKASWAALNQTRVTAAPQVAAGPAARPPSPVVRPGSPRRRSTLRDSLTAPMLLGLAGATLLIASAVVFVAVTWDTFFPPAQALLLLVLAAATGWLADWLTRRGLGVSAGAVGVVSMAFAGTAVVALARALTVLGPFTTAVAALAAGAAGTALARRGIAWVAATSAVALAVAGLGAAFAGGFEHGVVGWTVWGSGAAAALALLSRRWLDGTPRTALEHASVGLVPVIALGAVLLGWGDAQIAWAWLPAAVGVGMVAWLPAIAAMPAVAVATGVGAAMASALPDPGAAMILVAALASAALAGGLRFPEHRIAILRGLLPAAVGTGIAALGVLGDSVVALGNDGTEAALTQEPGMLLAGLVCAALATLVIRGWDAPQADGVVFGGAVLLVALLPPIAVELRPEPTAAGLSVATVLVAVAGAGVARAWQSGPARRLISVVAVALGGVGGLLAVAAWADAGSSTEVSALALAVPVALAAGLARWFPRALGSLAFALPSLGVAATVLRLTADAGWAMAALALSGTVLAWIASRMSSIRRLWALPGAVPALLAVCIAGLVTVSQLAAWAVSSGEREPTLTHPALGVTMVAGVLAAASARPRARARALPRAGRADLRAAIEIAGVAALLAAAMQVVLACDAGGMVLTAVAAVGVGTSLVVAASAWWWDAPAARLAAFLGASIWTSMLAVMVLMAIAEGAVVGWRGALVVSLASVALILGARWRATVTVPFVVAVLPLLPAALVTEAWGRLDVTSLTAAAMGAAASWVLTMLPRRVARRAALGLVTSALVTLPAIVLAGGDWMLRLLAPWDRGATASWSLTPVLLAAAIGTGVMATPWGRLQRVWIVVALLIGSLAALPASLAWVIAAVAAIGSVLVPTRFGLRARHSFVLAAVAVPWAGPHAWPMSGVMLALALVLAVLARRDHARRSWLAHSSLLALSLSAWLACVGADASPLAPALAVGTYGAGLSALLRLRLLVRDHAVTGLSVISVLAAGAAIDMHSLTYAGLTSLVASAAWLVLRPEVGLIARWIAGIFATAGIGLLLVSAGIDTLEAYTLAPAVWAIAEGVAWMRRDVQVPSVTAVGGGLALAIVPSVIALAIQPGALVRTLLLTVAIAFLAFATVLLRWLAPAVAAASTAIAVALAQLLVADQLLPRWVSFAVVGAVLIALAATYERLKELR
ncbi:hypothetical protein RN607_03825 [Demequina capsici]|uniref:Uncharacterized protein n=1 Tax=Demequina capsici TaxID=3075620 RepID=A0AA96FDI1_9MICO|nr:hypothetical protein [Demequina sp. PMTSA13]WNM28143.1 hypothetical protein RN607_03825 [Demequina sp. PMTSA13]